MSTQDDIRLTQKAFDEAALSIQRERDMMLEENQEMWSDWFDERNAADQIENWYADQIAYLQCQYFGLNCG